MLALGSDFQASSPTPVLGTPELGRLVYHCVMTFLTSRQLHQVELNAFKTLCLISNRSYPRFINQGYVGLCIIDTQVPGQPGQHRDNPQGQQAKPTATLVRAMQGKETQM